MLLVSSKEENEILNILNCMSIVFKILIIYFIVYILDHVDHEDLPRDGFGALSIIRPSMQLVMLCKCVFSRKKFLTNQALMSLFFMYTSNMSSKFTVSFKCLIAEITFKNHV